MPNQLASFAEARSHTLALLASLSQPQLEHKPSPEKWSLGEVFDHLHLAERFFRSQIELLIDQYRSGQSPSLALSFRDLNVRPAYVPACLLPWFEVPLTITSRLVPRRLLERLLTTPLGRARHPDVANPRPDLPKTQLQTQLTEGIAQTRALFEQNQDVDFSQLRVKHPLLGNNTVLDLLDVMSLHERGHFEKMRESVARLPGGLASPGYEPAPVSAGLTT